MSRSPSPTPQKGSVRSIISIFESQSYIVEDEPTHLIRRTKSMGNLSQKPRVVVRKTIERIEPERREEIVQNLELTQIEQQIDHLQKNLTGNYKTYSRENHIYHQNQIIFILTDLANVETKGHADTIHKKTELGESLKRLNKKLNALLPSGVNTPVVKTSIRRENVTVRSRSFQEKPNKKKEAPKKIEAPRVIEQVEEVFEETEDEVDTPVSVRNLKEIFEKNTTEDEVKREFGTKISRKFTTFNGTSDLKYVPFSEKYKSALDTEFQKQTLNIDEVVENAFSSREVIQRSDDEGDEERPMSPDSLSKNGSSEGKEWIIFIEAAIVVAICLYFCRI